MFAGKTTNSVDYKYLNGYIQTGLLSSVKYGFVTPRESQCQGAFGQVSDGQDWQLWDVMPGQGQAVFQQDIADRVMYLNIEIFSGSVMMARTSGREDRV